MKNNTLEEISEQLNKSKEVAIFCHVRPDGDTLGSGLALCLALNNAGKKAFVFCEDLPPEKFSFLSAVSLVKNEFTGHNFDTFVSVDCADLQRLGIFSKCYAKFKGIKLNVDHHISNDGYGDYNFVEVCPATCEIMTELLKVSGFEITKDVAELLTLGLITDSGNFTHLDVTPRTYLTGAFLREKGADMNLINYNMYGRQSKARALLYGIAASKLRFALEDKFAYVVITLEDLVKAGAEAGVTEGFVDFPLSVDGVEVAASIMENKTGQYKVSLRSKGKVNVSSLAATFGGGGHVLASGCMLFGSLEEVLDKLTYAVYQNL